MIANRQLPIANSAMASIANHQSAIGNVTIRRAAAGGTDSMTTM
jgi:hypothetical protein